MIFRLFELETSISMNNLLGPKKVISLFYAKIIVILRSLNIQCFI